MTEYIINLNKVKEDVKNIAIAIGEFEATLAEKVSPEFRSSSSYSDLVHQIGRRIIEEYVLDIYKKE